MNPQPGIRIGIVEDDPATLAGLRVLVESEPSFSLVLNERTAERALARVYAAQPDVLLLDIQLPGQSGAAAVPQFLQRLPPLRILMLTVNSGQRDALEALDAGAAGYLLKRTPWQTLAQAIRDVHAGHSPMSPEIAVYVIDRLRQVNAAARASHTLTPQETRLLELIAEGHTYESAGRQLSVTVNTVRNHVREIYRKMRVHSKNEAVSKAIRAGLIR